MNIVTHTISAAVVPLSAMMLSKSGNFLAQTVPMPDWLSPMLGPVGALVGTLLAIKWLLTRLDRAEQKADVRDQERDKNLQLIASMTVQNQAVIKQNSEVLSDVKQAIEKMTP